MKEKRKKKRKKRNPEDAIFNGKTARKAKPRSTFDQSKGIQTKPISEKGKMHQKAIPSQVKQIKRRGIH